jgi:DnaJ homolog subfamily A member 2
MDFYEVLNVSRDADPKTITKAYRKLAIKYHPDKNSNPEAVGIFQNISRAHEVLSDPKTRQIYDRYGEEGLKQGGMNFNPFQQNRRPAIKIEYTVSLEDYFTEEFVMVPLEKTQHCSNCNGSGFKDGIKRDCTTCHGVGVIQQRINMGGMIQIIESPCPGCRGTGISTCANYPKCVICNGTMQEKVNVKIKVDIPRNLEEMHTIVPEQGPLHQGSPVDVLVAFTFKSRGKYYVKDDILTYVMPINFVETICGFRRTISHPSGNAIMIVCAKGWIVNMVDTYIIHGLGLNGDNMHIEFNINYPDSIKLPSKKIALDYNNLELVLGDRYPCDNNYSVNPENIYYLDAMSKIVTQEKNYHSDEEHSDNNSDSDDGPQHPGQEGCRQM